MGRARLVTLTSDLGPLYAAQVKAILYRSLRPDRVIELTHELPAHQVEEGAFLLQHLARGFPRGTVHLAIVDPGVGGVRRPLAIQCRDGSVLVGPDNGLLAPFASLLGGGKAYRLDPGRIRSYRPRVGATFDGRDLFAPAAAQIALGANIAELGAPATYARLPSAAPGRSKEGARGSVVHVDRFGNAITDLPSEWLPRHSRRLWLRLGRRRPILADVRPIYADLARGKVGVLPSSFGSLEIGMRESRASDVLRVQVGDAVGLNWRGRKLPARARDGKYRAS